MLPPTDDTHVPQPSETPEQRAALERALREQLAVATGGLAPGDYVNAWWDWYVNVAKQPPKQSEILQDAWAKAMDNWNFALQAASGAPMAPSPGDARFSNDVWSRWPFNVYAHSYGNLVDWWQKSWSEVPGVAPKSAQTLDLVARNVLESLSPTNYLATNPELLETTRAEAGANLARGFGNWLEDVERTFEHKGPAGTEKFIVGKDVAATPGKIVLRNELIELIQYSPQTETVFAEPVLIIPAWIMKYYILDLSPQNSLVRYLVSQGHTVFMVSWKNPTQSDSALGMDDYLRLGVRASIDAVSQIAAGVRMHSVGYCIGGTLLSIAAAALAAEGDTRLSSVTLLAAQQDFSEPGELSVFISPGQLDALEAVMSRNGVLKSEQMGAAFSLLRARDLLWKPAVDSYLRGKREAPNDLMSWNADGTRMPCRMHAEYLRALYLNNALARGEFDSEGRRIDLSAVRLPLFVVGTETDHVAPWQSVYKARGLTRSEDYTFLLTSGGHNAGIVSGPTHPRRRYRIRTWRNATDMLDPKTWFDTTASKTGSWWPIWQQWLAEHSGGTRVSAPQPSSSTYLPLGNAPGQYVLQK
jgi:polyhydroxyalkanoate synthase